jgi:uncharacterized membrane protein YeaQ/YmgE (transglycosylase-associated protein family)
MDVLFYLGGFLLLLPAPGVIASTFIANADEAGLALVLGIVGAALGTLCLGLWAAVFYHHPEWPWPLPLGKSGMTRREHAFLLAWICFVGAAGFGALTVLFATHGLSVVNSPAFTIGAVIVIVIIGAPAWVVSRRMRRRTQGAR